METTGERDVVACFSARYSVAQNDATRAIEVSVIGGDWGANGYTTCAQADVLARELALGPGARLLDVGAGRGWPGVYLAATTGCSVVLVDVPMAGLVSAVRRSTDDGLVDRVGAVVASARHLPLGSMSVDGVAHADVMCCVRAKVTIFRECRRVLRSGGRTAFYTIHCAEELSPVQRKRAARDGPPFVGSTRGYSEMLHAAGFIDVRGDDRTGEFREVALGWINQRDAHREELVSSLGEEAFDERQANSRAQLRAIDEGLLCRSLFSARVR